MVVISLKCFANCFSLAAASMLLPREASFAAAAVGWREETFGPAAADLAATLGFFLGGGKDSPVGASTGAWKPVEASLHVGYDVANACMPV